MEKLNDLRFVIGLFFAVVGAILLATAAFGPNDVVAGVRLNLFAGTGMGLFGAVMLLLSTTSSDD